MPFEEQVPHEQGFTYLAAMCAIVLLGISLTVVGESWKVSVQRDREAELRFRGMRIKAAIEAYAADYEVRKGTRTNIYPLRLEQLVEGPKRYLPVVYKDPITGEDFELAKVNGEIRGVKSRSADVPLDQVHFNGAAAYHQILFQAIPPSSPGQACASPVNPLNPLSAVPSGECPTSPGASVPP